MKTHALLGAALGLALSFGAAGMANATVYTFTEDGCTGTCGTGPFGTVTVTPDGSLANTLDFLVQLSGTETFHDTNDSQHHALTFDMVGNPTITISGLGSPFTINGSQSAGSNSSAPFGGPAWCPWAGTNNCGVNDEPFSFHGGGCNTLFMDGHVTFLRESIHPYALRTLCTAIEGLPPPISDY